MFNVVKEFHAFQDYITECLLDNGWEPRCDPDDEMIVFVKTMSWNECKSLYDIEMELELSVDERGIRAFRELGVLDIRVKGFKKGRDTSYGMSELQSFARAIRLAEDQLFMAGVPFCTEYSFENEPDIRNEKNRKLREEMNLEQISHGMREHASYKRLMSILG